MLPSFIVIGGQRCATTWLHKALDSHPEICMSQTKEPNYFYRWMLSTDLAWYEDQFKHCAVNNNKIAVGEISPSYSTLKVPVIRLIKSLMPDLKIILVVRNPVIRTWSQALLEFGIMKQRRLERIPVMKFLRHFKRQRTIRRSDFSRILKNWETVFGRDAIHVAIYDDMQLNSRVYLEGIFTHIGVSSDWMPSSSFLNNKVLASQSLTMPPIIRWYLANQWYESVRQLNAYLMGRIDSWEQEIADWKCDTNLRWRILASINDNALSLPERMGYEIYDRWRDIKMSMRAEDILNSSRSNTV